jgi:3-methyladenine DNA glycosylase AlkC
MSRLNLPFAMLHAAALLAVLAIVDSDEGNNDVAVLTSKVAHSRLPFSRKLQPAAMKSHVAI